MIFCGINLVSCKDEALDLKWFEFGVDGATSAFDFVSFNQSKAKQFIA